VSLELSVDRRKNEGGRPSVFAGVVPARGDRLRGLWYFAGSSRGPGGLRESRIIGDLSLRSRRATKLPPAPSIGFGLQLSNCRVGERKATGASKVRPTTPPRCRTLGPCADRHWPQRDRAGSGTRRLQRRLYMNATEFSGEGHVEAELAQLLRVALPVPCTFTCRSRKNGVPSQRRDLGFLGLCWADVPLSRSGPWGR